MATASPYIPKVFTHPGRILSEKLGELALSASQFAERIGWPETAITEVISGRSRISADMAVILERELLIPASFWNKSQARFEEYLRGQESVSWADMFPFAEMCKNRWFDDSSSLLADRQRLLLDFFGTSSVSSWNAQYQRLAQLANFRTTSSDKSQLHSIAAWLRRGEMLASGLTAQSYDKEKFEEVLLALKPIMASQPTDFFGQLQALCLQAGVKVVFTPNLPGTQMFGVAQWLGDTPLIQLTGLYKNNYEFWFTFYHEAGHILLHSKDDVFFDMEASEGMDIHKEREADAFAQEHLFPEEVRDYVLTTCMRITEPVIIETAELYGVHPAIIIRSLQKEGHLKYSFGAKYIVQIDLSK